VERPLVTGSLQSKKYEDVIDTGPLFGNVLVLTLDFGLMTQDPLTGALSSVNPHYVATLVLVLAPIGAILGDSFISHLVQDELMAVWLTIAGLMILGTYALSLSSQVDFIEA
jgi:hypothetical protein